MDLCARVRPGPTWEKRFTHVEEPKFGQVSTFGESVFYLNYEVRKFVGTKRHIKVKALQAAKCLEEKRQNEGKMKKEALKLERARVEQEIFLQMELRKKKKEEERRRKDADTEARKRLREEEERKEKKRKRHQTEEAQQLREENLRVGKVEKEDKKVVNKKEPEGNFRKHQKLEKERGDKNTGRKQPTEPRAADSSTSNVILVVHACEAFSIGNDTGEELKFELASCSKNSVALAISSQQEVNPDNIFPLESFCSMNEVIRT